MGFEPTVEQTTLVFKTRTLIRSVIYPQKTKPHLKKLHTYIRQSFFGQQPLKGIAKISNILLKRNEVPLKMGLTIRLFQPIPFKIKSNFIFLFDFLIKLIIVLQTFRQAKGEDLVKVFLNPIRPAVNCFIVVLVEQLYRFAIMLFFEQVIVKICSTPKKILLYLK